MNTWLVAELTYLKVQTKPPILFLQLKSLKVRQDVCSNSLDIQHVAIMETTMSLKSHPMDKCHHKAIPKFSV